MGGALVLRGTSLFGLVVMVGIAWALSENRRAIRWRPVVWGLALQFILAILILRTGFGRAFFEAVNACFAVLTSASKEGSKFVFGKLTESYDIGAIVAFQVLPVIIFVSSLAAILQHLRIIQAVVNAMAWVMRRTMGTSGAETFAAALQVFLGIESLPASRDYLADMTRSELFVIMVTFMGTIATSVMVAYASFGAEPGHLLAASIMCAPSALMISKLMIPETGRPRTDGSTRIVVPIETRNVIDAASRGASEGLNLALNVGAMLIAFIALVYLADLVVKGVTGHTFASVMGWFFYPFAFLMGVPSSDVGTVAELLGKKTVLNEFLAYADFKPLVESGALHPRSVIIATYALCGFANPGSLGILLGALTAMLPGRRAEIAGMGIKSLIAGTLTCFVTACIAGMLLA
jgi:CNT family concentrative nucleoside transporter